jgi:hypothetical protein
MLFSAVVAVLLPCRNFAKSIATFFCSFAENEDAANYVLCNILRQPNLLRFVMLYASDETTSRLEPTFV